MIRHNKPDEASDEPEDVYGAHFQYFDLCQRLQVLQIGHEEKLQKNKKNQVLKPSGHSESHIVRATNDKNSSRVTNKLNKPAGQKSKKSVNMQQKRTSLNDNKVRKKSTSKYCFKTFDTQKRNSESSRHLAKTSLKSTFSKAKKAKQAN